MTHRTLGLYGACVTAALALAQPTRSAAQDATATDCPSGNQLAGKKPMLALGVQGDVALVTDDSIALDGARWDAPGTVLLANTTAALTYDLGRVQRVTTVFVQADANDTYQLSGSADGEHFEPLAEVPNVVQSGHGLRQRIVPLAARSIRYLRLGEARGDAFYSVSELALYCQTPAHYPGASADTAALTEHATGDAALDGSPHWTGVLSIMAGLLLASLIAFIAAKRGARGPTLAEATDQTQRIDRRLHAMFLLSGCAALIYEIVWFHLMRLVIGASALSVGLVLASFMGGMFLGSLGFSRLVSAHHNPLRVYAWLEIGIGVFGLAMPWLLPAIRSLYIGLFGYGAASIALRAVIAAVLLLPPTALMGATLPAVARRYGNSPRAGAALASLYAANTFGAVLGCLLTGFLLLAVWNVWVATLTAVALNFAIGAFALWTARLPSSEPATPSAAEPAGPRQHALIYLAAGLSGLTALGSQVIWTRLLTLLFGATVYAFAIILAVFLAGLGLGGAFATFWLRRSGSAVRGLLLCQLGLIATLFTAGYLLTEVLPYSAPSTQTPTLTLHLLDMLRAIDVILPAACLWGMSFPLAIAAVSGGHQDGARASGQLYAANTLGAILGALATSFWLIPSFGTHRSAQVLVLCATAGAAVLAYADSARRVRFAHSLFVLACGVLAAGVLPGMPVKFLAHGRHIWSITPGDTYPYVSEGAASTVAVHVAPDGYRHFHVSGRVEASNNPDDLRLERMLGHLSALAHPHPESVLVVGLGAGVTAGALGVHPEIKRIVICEIEPRVTGATRQFAHENYAILDDPRVELVFDDARHFLATTRERFDVITSDPIHPWVRGNSMLFSKQYYAIVREHLRPGGIATQWVPLYDTNEEAIRIQMRTFSEAFVQSSIWNSAVSGGGYDVVLLGRTEASRLSIPAMQARIDANPKLAASLREVHIGSAVELLVTYAASGADMPRFTAGAPINDDFSLKLEYISGLALNQQHADQIYTQMVGARTSPTGLFDGPEAPELLQRIAQKR